MKGVMLEVPNFLIEQRRISGADQWDEVWEGVLHMVPPPNIEHQNLEGLIETWLRTFWVPTQPGNKVLHQVALSPDDSWVQNYRTPDIVLFNSQHQQNLRPTFCHGPCTVAIEIRSPNDESYDKLAFYLTLGVPEVWVIDRDSKHPEVFVLTSGAYQQQAPNTDGWLTSTAVPIMLKHGSNSLVIQLTNIESTCRTLGS